MKRCPGCETTWPARSMYGTDQSHWSFCPLCGTKLSELCLVVSPANYERWRQACDVIDRREGREEDAIKGLMDLLDELGGAGFADRVREANAEGEALMILLDEKRPIGDGRRYMAPPEMRDTSCGLLEPGKRLR